MALLIGLIAYAVGVGVGVALVNLVSTNRHDRAAEAVMTGFFVAGPILAILAIIVFFVVHLLRRA